MQAPCIPRPRRVPNHHHRQPKCTDLAVAAIEQQVAWMRFQRQRCVDDDDDAWMLEGPYRCMVHGQAATRLVDDKRMVEGE